MPVKKAKRADGRYQTSVNIGRDASGKIRKKFFYGKTQKEANAKKKAYLDGTKVVTEDYTVSVWSDRWMKVYASGGVRNKSNNRSILNRFCDDYGHYKLIEIKPADIQSYARKQSEYTKSHVNKVRRCLDNLFRTAQENGYILDSPCKGIVWESRKTGTHKFLSNEIVDLIKDNWSIHPAGTWAMLMLYAGLRPSEAFALDRSNISGGFISVTDGSHFEHGKLVIVKGQAKSEAGQRRIPIVEPLRSPLEVLDGEGLVCVSTKGLNVSQAACRANWKAFWNMLEDIYNGVPPRGAGRRTDRLPEDWKYLPEVQMYDLRHTYCSMLYEADVDVKTAQYLMGHASLDVTLKIYTHLSEAKKLRSYDKLHDYFKTKDVKEDVTKPENPL